MCNYKIPFSLGPRIIQFRSKQIVSDSIYIKNTRKLFMYHSIRYWMAYSFQTLLIESQTINHSRKTNTKTNTETTMRGYNCSYMFNHSFTTLNPTFSLLSKCKHSICSTQMCPWELDKIVACENVHVQK